MKFCITLFCVSAVFGQNQLTLTGAGTSESVSVSGPAFVRVNATACQNTSAAATLTCPLTSSTAGDWLIAAVSWKTVSRTMPYICSGAACNQTTTANVWYPYTQAICNTGTGDTCSQLWVCPNCGSISSITADWSGTTLSDLQVAEYSGVKSIGQVTCGGTNPCTGNSSAAPSISITIQDSSNIIVMATSSAGNDGVPTSSTGNLRGASRSGTTNAFDAGSLCDNSSASAGTSVSCTVSITSGIWTAQGLELRGAVATQSQFIESIAHNTPGANETATPSAFTAPFVSDAMLSGNTGVCSVSYQASLTLSTIQTLNSIGGSAVDTFSLDETVSGSVSNLTIGHVAATAGVQYLLFTFSGAFTAPPNFAYSCTALKGIATSSAVDTMSGTASEAGPKLSAGAMTTTASDLIYTAAFPDAAPSGANQGTGYCGAGTGQYLVAVNVVTAFCTQTSLPAVGPYNPSLYLPSSTNVSTASVNVAAVAYKLDGTKGTSPSGIYIARLTQWFNVGVGYIYGNCPASGNFMSGVTSQPSNPGSLLDSNQDATTNNQPNSAYGVLSYLVNTSLDSSSMCRWRQESSSDDEELLRDVANVATSSPLDGLGSACPSPSTFGSTGCFNSASGVSGSQANLPNIQPSATGELVLAVNALGTGPISNLTAPSGSVLDCPYYAGMTDATWYCSGNGHGHLITTAATAENWTWTIVNTTSPAADAWALKHK